MVVQRIRRPAEVMGDAEVVGPTTNHGGTLYNPGCSAFLEWPITHDLVESPYDTSDCFPWDMNLWHGLPALTGIEHHVETEKVETVADVGDAGLFVRELHTAIAAEQLSDSITQSLCVSLGTPRDEHAPVIRITYESNIGLLESLGVVTCFAIMPPIVQEPVQTIQDHVGEQW